MKKDVVIVGSGPSGLSLACLLDDLGLQVLIIEKSQEELIKEPKYDGRETALTHPSKDILSKIGSWKRLKKSEISLIKEAKVLNGNSNYSLDFKNDDPKKEALGYLVSNHAIRRTLYEEMIERDNIQLLSYTIVDEIKVDDECSTIFLSNNQVIKCNLIVGADSRFSKTRTKMGISSNLHDFARNMLVCKMSHEKDHQHIALECFFNDRVMAALPLGKKTSSIVITVDDKKAKELKELSTKEFSLDIENYLEKYLGKVTLKSEIYQYPLTSVYADKFYSKRFALIGDACVGMHPVTAHGYNLGLIGQNILYQEIKKALSQKLDIGSDEVLQNYSLKHQKETKVIYHGTNTIVNLFTNNCIPAKFLRNSMLRIANSKFLPFKSIISNRLTGDNKGFGLKNFIKKIVDI